MNQRDELAQDVAAAVFEAADTLACADIESSTDAVLVGHFDMRKAADHLIGLGYFRPRVVETEGVGALETLWVLPVGTIIECGSGMLWRKVKPGMYGWAGTGEGSRAQPDVFMHDIPLTILHLPEETP